jgi:hypothetical protein
MRQLFWALVCVAALAGPVAACAWDLDTTRQERRFKSDYNQSAPPTSVITTSDFVNGGVVLTAGVLLFAGAGYVVYRIRQGL